MGSEERIAITHQGRKVTAIALLETDELIIRGEPRIRIPFRSIVSISIADGVLIIDHPNGPTSLELGARAERWAEKIRSPRSRLDKLGVKSGCRAVVIGELDEDFVIELTQRVGTLASERDRSLDLLFLAVNDRATLDRLEALKTRLAPDGALWVVRPKGVDSVTERDVMAAGKAAGLVDTKVVRFSETHTAEKYVIPLQSR